MKPKLTDKLRYRFENFIGKGGKSVFISIFGLFILSFTFSIILRWLLLLFIPGFDKFDSFLDHIWATFLTMADPGGISVDTESSPLIKIASILSMTLGIIIISMLIALITNMLDLFIREFRKGKGKSIESGHTLILGWNDRVLDIVRELIIANESEKKAAVVILSNEPKEEMDDIIKQYIINSKTTKIVTRYGDPALIHDLLRVNADNAKSVIVMASCSDSACNNEKIESDTHSIKIIMALIACQNGNNELPIIAEVFNKNKRELVEYLESDKIITLDSWEIMGKLLVQTALTSGLEVVYNEILSFDGCEIYFSENKWNNTPFYSLYYHFKDGIPLGIQKSDGSLLLRPPKETIMQDDDEIIILAEDDSTINFNQDKLFESKEIALSKLSVEKNKQRVIILGHHYFSIINEFRDYLPDGSSIDLMMNNPSESIIEEMSSHQNNYPKLNINLIQGNTLDYDSLKSSNPLSYDIIIILSQSEDEISSEKNDSDTLMILLLLRKLGKELGTSLKQTKIITQILNPENKELIAQTEIDDFIISNKLITMILAQLSEEPRIHNFYNDIFKEDGSEIYVKPANLYFETLPIKLRFIDIMTIANKRDEICLGIRIGKLSGVADQNFGITLNPDKDYEYEISEEDFLVVLSEDEL